MTPEQSWSLADRPWIDVLDSGGRREVLSLACVLERAEEVHLASADPLLWAATVRLLVTIAYTAGCAPTDQGGHQRNVVEGIDLAPAAAWVREHGADLDLFGDRPLFQDAALQAIADVPGATVPVLYLDMTAAIGRPLLSDHRHLHASVPVTARRAAELVLIQQMWAIGGRISAKDAIYGPGCNFGRPAPASGSLVWQPAGTLAEMLAWRLMPLPEGPGMPQWTYRPRGADTEEFTPDSEADALTWHHRRILLLPDHRGTVAQVLFAQGWRTVKQPHATVCLLPGSRDLVDTESGRRLPAEAVTGESDLVPVLERWWLAPEGSWAHAARQVITATGRAPDLVTVGLATNKKKLLHQRWLHIPAAALADPRSASAAAAVMGFRRHAARAAPNRRATASTGTLLPPSCGFDLLTLEEFLTAPHDQREAALFEHVRPAPGGDPVRNSRRTGALAAAALTTPLPQDGPADIAQPEPTTTHGPKTDGAGQQELFTIASDNVVIAPPTAGPAAPEAEPDELDDEDLFTTAATPSARGFTEESTGEGADLDRPEDVGRTLAARLGRWAASPHTRGIMADLGRWAVQPSVNNPARHLVTRNVPDEQHQAAMLVAALFAIHYRTNKSAPRYGSADLPRLMRAFGSGGRYGPRHVPTGAAVTRILRTHDIERLRTPLLRQIRYAATKGMAPHWGRLFDDLASWDQPVRDRWAHLFYTSTAVAPGTASVPAPLLITPSVDKDPISA